MKLAVVGSRTIVDLQLERYIPDDVTEIVCGGAKGVDSVAEKFAQENGIKLKVFLANYSLYGKVAPLKRNEEIAEYADALIAFWTVNRKVLNIR